MEHPDTLYIVVPCYNEEEVLPETARRLRAKLEALTAVLARDPRPRYQEDPERVYGLAFAGKNVKFTVRDRVLTVLAVEE